MACSVGYRFNVAQLEGKTYLLAVDKSVEPDPVVVDRLVCLNHNIKSLRCKRQGGEAESYNYSVSHAMR